MGWIAVDLDGTLAQYGTWAGPTEIGEPIPAMVERVKKWLADGVEVRIFTARAYPLGYVHEHDGHELMPVDVSSQIPMAYELLVAHSAVHAIQEWCLKHIGRRLPVTCVKDYKMYELWDDRAVQVERNTGRRMDNEPEGDTTP
jgi:hypothetical protein